MCALAAMAEFPEWIKRIFVLPGEKVPQEYNDVGLYEVRVCKNGEWTRIRLGTHHMLFCILSTSKLILSIR